MLYGIVATYPVVFAFRPNVGAHHWTYHILTASWAALSCVAFLAIARSPFARKLAVISSVVVFVLGLRIVSITNAKRFELMSSEMYSEVISDFGADLSATATTAELDALMSANALPDDVAQQFAMSQSGAPAMDGCVMPGLFVDSYGFATLTPSYYNELARKTGLSAIRKYKSDLVRGSLRELYVSGTSDDWQSLHAEVAGQLQPRGFVYREIALQVAREEARGADTDSLSLVQPLLARLTFSAAVDPGSTFGNRRDGHACLIAGVFGGEPDAYRACAFFHSLDGHFAYFVTCAHTFTTRIVDCPAREPIWNRFHLRLPREAREGSQYLPTNLAIDTGSVLRASHDLVLLRVAIPEIQEIRERIEATAQWVTKNISYAPSEEDYVLGQDYERLGETTAITGCDQAHQPRITMRSFDTVLPEYIEASALSKVEPSALENESDEGIEALARGLSPNLWKAIETVRVGLASRSQGWSVLGSIRAVRSAYSHGDDEQRFLADPARDRLDEVSGQADLTIRVMGTDLESVRGMSGGLLIRPGADRDTILGIHLGRSADFDGRRDSFTTTSYMRALTWLRAKEEIE